MKFPFVLSVILAAFATSTTSANAQSNPVLVEEVVYYNSFSTKEYNSAYALYKYNGNLIDSYIPFNYKKSAIYVSAYKPMVLYSLKVQRPYHTGNKGILNLYGKGTNYSTSSDLYSPDLKGELLGSMQFDDNIEVEIENFPKIYRYWGIGKEDNDADPAILQLTVTWAQGYERNVTPQKFGTLSLPYDVPSSSLAGVAVYKVMGKTTHAEGEALVCDAVDHIKAGKPYLFKTDNSSLFLLYENPDSYQSAPLSENGAYGNFTATTVGDLRKEKEGDIYVVSDNSLMKAGNAVTIGANRAYIRYEELPEITEPSSNRFIFTENGMSPFSETHTTTSIPCCQSMEPSSPHSYDILGRPSSASRGLILLNGKVRMQ